MFKCYLEDDKTIGHEVIAKRKGLFKKEVSLTNLSYNSLIKNILSQMDEVSPEFLYNDIKYSIIQRAEYNAIQNLSLRKGGKAIGKNKLERRINNLRFEFTNLYLNRALKILEEINEKEN
jgi:hypothetical protein